MNQSWHSDGGGAQQQLGPHFGVILRDGLFGEGEPREPRQ